MAKKSISIDEKLYDDVKEYCLLNDLKISEFCEKLIKAGLINEKWGDAPFLTSFRYNKKDNEVVATTFTPVIVDSVSVDINMDDNTPKKQYLSPETKVENKKRKRKLG